MLNRKWRQCFLPLMVSVVAGLVLSDGFAQTPEAQLHVFLDGRPRRDPCPAW